MVQPKTRSIIAANNNSAASADSAYVAGIDIGGSNLRLALADMTGIVVAKWSSSIAGVRGAEAIVALISVGIERLLQQVSAPRHALKAVAAGAPGVTDSDAGIVIATSYLMEWRNVPLRAMLEDALNAPVAIDNDVNIAALGENWAGAAKNARDFVFLAIGTGIGAGILLNGSLFHGTGWCAGEIGYMLLPGMAEIPGNPGEPGALESMIGGEGIKTQWQTLWRADGTTLPKESTATQIFDHALTGDPLSQTILQQTARMLSLAIFNINLVLNCPLFVLGGGVGMHPVLFSATENMLQNLNMRGRPQLILSSLGADAQLMGAIRLALDTAVSRPPLFAIEITGEH